MNANFQAAALDFQHASEQFLREAKFQTLTAEQLEAVQAKIPLSSELIAWYQSDAPLDLYISLPGNNLYFPDATKLDRYQSGYRWLDDTEQTLDPLWNDNWIVIADVGADAVIAHVDQAETPISFALHGLGRWEPRPIAPSLAVYLIVLTEWIRLLGSSYATRSFLTENSELDPQALGEIQVLLAQHLSPEHQINFLWALWVG